MTNVPPHVIISPPTPDSNVPWVPGRLCCHLYIPGKDEDILFQRRRNILNERDLMLTVNVLYDFILTSSFTPNKIEK